MASPSELTNWFGPISLAVAGIWAVVQKRWARSDTKEERAEKKASRSQSALVINDANLRDDQREFIAVLQKENREWRNQVDDLRKTIDSLRDEIDGLRRELAVERRAREAAEARYMQMFERENRPTVDLRRRDDPAAQ